MLPSARHLPAPQAVTTAFSIETQFQDEHFNSDRDADDRLTSAPMEIVIRTPPSFAALVKSRQSAARDVTDALLSLVSVEVVFFDLTLPMIFSENEQGSPSSWRLSPLPPQSFTVVSYDPSVGRLVLAVDRRLPLSSSHGNRRLRLAFTLGDNVCVTPAFIVRAKKGKAGTKPKYMYKPAFVALTPERAAARERIIAAGQAGKVAVNATTAVTPSTVMPVRAAKTRVIRVAPRRGTGAGAGAPPGPSSGGGSARRASGGTKAGSAADGVMSRPRRGGRTSVVPRRRKSKRHLSALADMSGDYDDELVEDDEEYFDHDEELELEELEELPHLRHRIRRPVRGGGRGGSALLPPPSSEPSLRPSIRRSGRSVPRKNAVIDTIAAVVADAPLDPDDDEYVQDGVDFDDDELPVNALSAHHQHPHPHPHQHPGAALSESQRGVTLRRVHKRPKTGPARGGGGAIGTGTGTGDGEQALGVAARRISPSRAVAPLSVPSVLRPARRPVAAAAAVTIKAELGADPAMSGVNGTVKTKTKAQPGVSSSSPDRARWPHTPDTVIEDELSSGELGGDGAFTDSPLPSDGVDLLSDLFSHDGLVDASCGDGGGGGGSGAIVAAVAAAAPETSQLPPPLPPPPTRRAVPSPAPTPAAPAAANATASVTPHSHTNGYPTTSSIPTPTVPHLSSGPGGSPGSNCRADAMLSPMLMPSSPRHHHLNLTPTRFIDANSFDDMVADWL